MQQLFWNPIALYWRKRQLLNTLIKKTQWAKTLIIGSDNRSYKVTGIAKAAPTNSHLKIQRWCLTSIDKGHLPWLGGNSLQTYIRKTPQLEL